MAIATPGYEELISHFDLVQNYLNSTRSLVVLNSSYIGGSRARTQKYDRQISETLDHLFYHSSSWADTGIESSFMAGWRSVAALEGEASVVPPHSLQAMADLRSEYQGKMNDLERFTRNDTQRFLREARNAKGTDIKDVRDIRAQTTTVEVGNKAFDRADRLGPFGKLQTDAYNQIAFNQGAAQAAISKKIEVMECTDGPGCGWAEHHDPDIANGKLVSPEEAMANPIAHPHCVRQFIPRPDLNKDDLGKKDSGLSKVEKGVAIAAGLAAAGLALKLAVQVETTVFDPEIAARFARLDKVGSIYKKIFNQIGDKFGFFQTGEDGEIIPFYAPQPPGPTSYPMAVGGDFWQPFEAAAHPFSGAPNLRDWGDSVTNWGEAILDKRIKFPDLPDWVRNSVHALDSDSDNALAKKFMDFSNWVHANKANETGVEQLANVINFQAKARQWNDFAFLKHFDNLSSSISATWTKYGPRTRIDLTEFLRGRVTLTKDGIRRSLTLNPAGNLRTMMGLSQDGTIIGAVRLVPNRLFRAIIETDEFGNISGNIRLVPKDWPFKIIAEFKTPRPKDWQWTGLIPGKDFVDLTARGAARGFGLQDFSMREAFGQLRQMELRNIQFEIKLFRDSIYDINAKWKIPIGEVKDALERLQATGFVRKDGAGWTGVFRWRPSFALTEEVQKIVAAGTPRIIGDISFSQLDLKLSSFLPDVKSKMYLGSQEARQVLTSVRISGITAIRDAKDMAIFNEIMQLPQAAWADFRNAMAEVDSRINLFMRDHNILKPENITEFIEQRLALVRAYFPAKNTAEIYEGALEAIRGLKDQNVIDIARQKHQTIPGGPTHQKFLRIMADIKDWDGTATIERKLQDFFFFSKSVAFQNQEIVDLLSTITTEDIHLSAVEMGRSARARTFEELRAVDPTPDIRTIRGERYLMPTATYNDLDRFEQLSRVATKYLAKVDPEAMSAVERYQQESWLINSFIRDGSLAELPANLMDNWATDALTNSTVTEEQKRLAATWKGIQDVQIQGNLGDTKHVFLELEGDAMHKMLTEERALMERALSRVSRIERLFDVIGDRVAYRPPVVYRGLRSPAAVDMLNGLSPGDVIKNNIFSSTSADLGVARRFSNAAAGIDPAENPLMLIKTGNGTGGFIINGGAFDTEYEWVLQTGVRLKVEEVIQELNYWSGSPYESGGHIYGGWQKIKVIVFQAEDVPFKKNLPDIKVIGQHIEQATAKVQQKLEDKLALAKQYFESHVGAKAEIVNPLLAHPTTNSPIIDAFIKNEDLNPPFSGIHPQYQKEKFYADAWQAFEPMKNSAIGKPMVEAMEFYQKNPEMVDYFQTHGTVEGFPGLDAWAQSITIHDGMSIYSDAKLGYLDHGEIGGVDAWLNAYSYHLGSALDFINSNVPDSPGIVFKGIPGGTYEAQMEALKVGDTIHTATFLDTTLDQAAADAVAMKGQDPYFIPTIMGIIPSGTNGAMLPVGEGLDYLFRSGANFRVVKEVTNIEMAFPDPGGGAAIWKNVKLILFKEVV